MLHDAADTFKSILALKWLFRMLYKEVYQITGLRTAPQNIASSTDPSRAPAEG